MCSATCVTTTWLRGSGGRSVKAKFPEHANEERDHADRAATLESRRETRPEGSYTAELLSGGLAVICRKVGEEATEVILAAHQDDRQQLVAEVADLWFHTLLLLVSEGLKVDDVLGELAARVGRPRRPTQP